MKEMDIGFNQNVIFFFQTYSNTVSAFQNAFKFRFAIIDGQHRIGALAVFLHGRSTNSKGKILKVNRNHHLTEKQQN